MGRVAIGEVVAENIGKQSSAHRIAELYQREHTSMVRLAYLITGSQSKAEEAVHDAFVALLERQERIDNPGGYLRRVVVNNCHGATRRSILGRKKVDALAHMEHARLVELPPEIDETLRTLNRVNLNQRTAIVLRYYYDLSVDEIAAAMNVRPGTVKSTLHRGLATLRKELSK